MGRDPFEYDTDWEAFKYRVAYREGYLHGFLAGLERLKNSSRDETGANRSTSAESDSSDPS